MDRDELLERYAAGERDFSQIEKIRADLRNADLSGANFRKVDFSSSDLRNANLSGANLRNAYFYAVNLEEANFTGADLRGAYFCGEIYETIFLDANLGGTTFGECTVRGATFYRANLDDTSIQDSGFHGVNFTRATLRRATIEVCRITNSIFIKTDLTDADWDFIEDDFRCAIFYKTIMPDGSIRNFNCR